MSLKTCLSEDLTLPRPSSQEQAQLGLDNWRERLAWLDDEAVGFARELLDHPQGRRLLEAVFGNSPFLSQCLLAEMERATLFLATPPEQAFTVLLRDLETALQGETDRKSAMRTLRLSRRRVALLVALADICGLWSVDRVVAALSRFADKAISGAVRFLLEEAIRRDHLRAPASLPDGSMPDPQVSSGYIVLGMGKLGAGELNYSSDIDLIVLYDDEIAPLTGKKHPAELYIRLTRDLVTLLQERTADGYVFRTDLRLRPDPGATPVALSRLAAETYYGSMGQNWERAAMIKARPVAGDIAAGRDFLRDLTPFMWRKYLDFAAIQDIQSIKRQIHAHKGGAVVAVAGHNVKLGRGGIREIEFYAQTQQLIWGGRDPSLRGSQTCEALLALAARGRMEEADAERLIDAYRFLRQTEHRLQMINDQQTQTLPEEAAQLEAFAVFMGFETLEAFAATLTEELTAVAERYAVLFGDSPELTGKGKGWGAAAMAAGAEDTGGAAGGDEAGSLVFTGEEDDPETLATLSRMGFANASAVTAVIRGWHRGRVRACRSERARQLLTEITPGLLSALSTTLDPDASFTRFNEFLNNLPAGVQLFSLFANKPVLLELVAEIMGSAPSMAETLSRHPVLLDSVLTKGFYDPLPSLPVLAADLDTQLAQARDFQDVLDFCRRWVNDRKFQVGLQLLRHASDGHATGPMLSDVAEAVLSRLVPQVIEEFATTHGHIEGASFALLALGKLGSREMSLTSDLDLICVYDLPARGDAAVLLESDGRKKLAAPVYFSRLAQRVINAITAKTGEGTLYEVDMRLRPSGNQGPIACSLETFARYQSDEAWTWEHLALTRARVVVGPPDLAGKLEAALRAVLTKPRDPEKLRKDTTEMRQRIDAERAARSIWEIKYIRGGLVDLEFIAQYLLLRHAPDNPALIATGTVPILQGMVEAGHLEAETGQALIEACRLWHRLMGALRLTVGTDALDTEQATEGLKQTLAKAGGTEDFQALRAKIEACAAAVQACYLRLLGEEQG